MNMLYIAIFVVFTGVNELPIVLNSAVVHASKGECGAELRKFKSKHPYVGYCISVKRFWNI